MLNNSSHAGKIIKIHLENFMSYDNINIYPGNNLNLVIGPNGTGKSSIVCAVLLCLGGKLKGLGRAEQFSSYIKTGCDECCIEIELYDPQGSNVTVFRKISSNNHSEFKINGKTCNATKVNEIRRKYNIQTDNLCTFLPQEKVQDFAKLNSQQLLDQVQRTIGNGELSCLHEELKKLRLKIAAQENLNNCVQDELESEKQKNDRLEDKIKRFKEKQSLCDQLVILNQKKAWLEYQLEVEKKREIDDDTELARTAYNQNKKKVEKFDGELAQLENDLSAHKQRINKAKKDEAGKKSVMEDRISRADRKIDDLEDLKNVMRSNLEEEENKKAEMLKCKENVEKLKNDLKNLDENIGSETELQKQKEEVGNQLKAIHAEEVRLNQTKGDLKDEEDTLLQECRNIVAECQSLKRRRDIRLEYIKRHEPDVYKSMEWLKTNKDLFSSPIYDPMLLELDVPNSKMAKFVEDRLGYRDLISFTCTNSEDLNLLIKKLRTEQKLKVNAICSENDENTQYSPEIPLSSLRDLGFHSYLKDLIQGPKEIIRFLCKTYKIHCIPVGDERVQTHCGKVPKNIQVFYSDSQVFSVKYSVYSGENSIRVKKLAEPRFFSQSIDERRLQILAETEKKLQLKLNQKQKDIKKYDDKLNQLRRDSDEVKQKIRKISTWIEERQQIQINLKRAVEKHNKVKETLRDPADIESETNTKRQALSNEIQRNIEDLKQASEDLEKAILDRQRCEIEFKINMFEKKQILEQKAQLTENLSTAEKQLRQMIQRQEEAERRCLQLKEKAKELTNDVSMEDKEFKKFQTKFQLLPNTLDDLETEIAETQAKANFLQGGNIQILQEYKEREKKIAQLTTTLENSRKNLDVKKTELSAKRNDWLEPVKTLVSNINKKFEKFFEAMGCAGEVSFVAGENQDDFDQYGIKIEVKFRKGPFQVLGRYFQSGGERAVSIAIFLLSLQELTSVPFRFVDEINQGMDPENERRIMELIIRVTAPTNSSQYFFITPKLLTDIQCSETMTVFCIYNGPNAIPAEKWNMKSFFRHAENEEDEENDEDEDENGDENEDEDENGDENEDEDEDEDEDD